MPIDVSEGSLELAIELLEAVTPTKSSYPFPSLRRSGRTEPRTFRTITLRNPFLEATVVPDLGGRIIRLVDLRIGRDVWPQETVLPIQDAGQRGVECPAGLQIQTDHGSRLNDLGPMAFALDFDPESESANGVWLSEICGNGLSLHIRYSMPEDRTELEVECRIFNRTLEYVPYDGGLQVPGATFDRLGSSWVAQDGATLLVSSVNAALNYADSSSLHRFGGRNYLAPRQLDTWKATLTPYRIEKPLALSDGFIVGWSDSRLEVEVAESLLGGKIVIQTDADQTLEMPTDLYPEKPLSIDLTGLPNKIQKLAILDSRGVAKLMAPFEPVHAPQSPDTRAQAPLNVLELSGAELHAATFDVAKRHWAFLGLAYQKLATADYGEGSYYLEQSLLFNAEDHLAWLLKGISERLGGNQDTERAELLNAHFLAPLEPALRAESFLANPPQSREKSPLLNSMEETPEVFVEVACLLLEASLYGEAITWLHEALLHSELPMLRYLLAFALLRSTQLDVQASDQLQLATSPEPIPPYPWRPIERIALEELSARFPTDSSVRRMFEISKTTR